ncbi:MAG TPA: hypothetical protein P5543_10145 [Planctomycetota bacterium]|nr:hypothetical protein [Planctomycetota bacterium]
MHESEFALGKICSGEFALGRKVAMESYSKELLRGRKVCSGEFALGMALLLWGHRQLLLGSNLWRKRCLKKETLDKKKIHLF